MLRAGLEDPLQRVDRVAVLGVDLQDRAQRGHRGRGVAQRLLLEPGDAEQQRLALVGAVGPARLLAQDLDQRGHVAGLGVQGLERRRRGPRGLEVFEIEVQHQLPGVDGGAPVAEAPAVEPRRARQQIGASADVGGVAAEGQLLVDVDQLGEPLERGGQTLDLGQRLRVPGVDRQHLAPGGQRRRARLQLVLLQIGDARQHRRRLGPLQRLALHLEHRHQTRPGAARLVERLEDARDAQALVGHGQQLLEQAPRPLVARDRAHDRLDQVERAVDVVEARRAQLGAPVGDVGDLGGRREAAARAQQLLEIAPALARGVVPVERAVGAQVGRVDPQHPFVAADGVVGIVEQRLVDLRHLGQQVEPLGRLLDQVLARVDEAAQVGPALALAVDAHQRLERARVQRFDLQDLGVDLLGVAGAPQALLVQLGDLGQQISAQRRVDAAGGDGAHLLGEVGDRLGLGGEVDQLIAVGAIGGIVLEQLERRRVGRRRGS